MEFTLPEARRERMEQLLEYLGDTSRYSEYYDGNRAEDFKKCFDIESEWCWKYADLMLRGMENRELEYAEKHHIVPRCFYKFNRRTKKADMCNMSNLSYSEHLYAHYCLASASIGQLKGKMIIAFYTMYNLMEDRSKFTIPDEQTIIDSLPLKDKQRIRKMLPGWQRVEQEGRAHRCDGEYEYKKSYALLHMDSIKEYRKDYYQKHSEEIKEKTKKWRNENVERRKEYLVKYNETAKDVINAGHRKWLSNNHEKHLEYKKKWYSENKEKWTDYNNKKHAAGFRRRKDPATGKTLWVFVGLPEQEVAA